MVDLGLTHVALPVSNLNDSIAFYTTYARMQVVHRRTVPTTGFEVAWMSDKTRPFVVVLSERSQVDSPLVPPAHLGVACHLLHMTCVLGLYGSLCRSVTRAS